jgi:23S rRNA (uracil1939-C5)-methyltransferase
VKVNDLLALDVGDVALGGKSLARHEGRAVFLDRGLPGDQVLARVTRVKRTWAEARVQRLEVASPLRVEAPCPHFHSGVCGGCRFQDLGYEDQLALKERQVRETLEHLGGVREPLVRPIRPAPETAGYRNKMEFSFHPGPDDRALLGLHERGTFEGVFDLETCILPGALTLEVVRLTRRLAHERRWRAHHPRGRGPLAEGGPAAVRYLTVRHLPHTRQCAVHLVATSDRLNGVEEWARAVAALSEEVRTVTLLINRSRANVAFGEGERLLVGDGIIVERLLGLDFEATANTFLQTNSRQAETLYAAALEAAALQGGETVLDLYCGTGTLTLLLARACGFAVGVESVADAVERARRNAERNGSANARFVVGEARPVLRQWARGERPAPWPDARPAGAPARAVGAPGPEVVVVDPPRAGLHPRVVFRVAELRPDRVVYVSCNPATLARDVKDFAQHGWRLAEVTPFDMFPHTPHIECVARLEPA